jgi:hypothetical protein
MAKSLNVEEDCKNTSSENNERALPSKENGIATICNLKKKARVA